MLPAGGRQDNTKERNTMARHMDSAMRGQIQFRIESHMSVAQVARSLGKPPSTIWRELLNHRIPSDKGYGRSNRLCAKFDACARPSYGATDYKSLAKNRPGCFEACPDFREAVCERLAKAPFVCNGCERERSCPLMKRFYIADGAQAAYRSALVNSRAGVRQDDGTLERMGEAVREGLKRGQSVSHILRANGEMFRGCADSTVYGWVNGGLFGGAGRSTLPFACSRRKPRKRPVTKTDAKCRVGRSMKELHAWLQAHPGVVPAEVDTVVGSPSGKALYTMCFPKSRLALAFLRGRRTAQTTTRIFNMLWDLAGPKLFARLFAATLPDNGPEFSDPEAIENHRPDPVHNSTKTLPRGVRVFYCDPYCPSQKPHVERVHVELRRIFEKGAPFDALSQEHVNLAMSHINSLTRDTLDGRCAYDAFVDEFGEDGRKLLDALGLRRIPASQVTLHPFLLGERFQRVADKAVLRRNGIGKTGPDGLKK